MAGTDGREVVAGGAEAADADADAPPPAGEPVAETPSGPAAAVDAERPLVSVVVTTFRRNDLLERAVESALEQTYDPVEVIVVDGSGDEHAREVVERFPSVTYVPRSENRGPVADRNLGFEHAAGEYVHFLDDDDRLAADTLARQVPVIDADPAVGVVYTGVYRQRDGKPLVPDAEDRGAFLETALSMQQPPCFPSTMLIDRSVLADCLPLPERLSGAGDTAMVIELARRTRFDVVAEPLVHRGEADESLAYTMESVEARRALLEEYADLYDDADADVRRTALAGSYELEGQVRLADARWSARAIRCFALAVRHDPDPGLDRYGALLASLFGSAVWHAARDGLVSLRRRREARADAEGSV